MRIHCLENVDKALQFLKEQRVHLENMGSHDIVDGNHRLTLGLIWTIILRFQVRVSARGCSELRLTSQRYEHPCRAGLCVSEGSGRPGWKRVSESGVSYPVLRIECCLVGMWNLLHPPAIVLAPDNLSSPVRHVSVAASQPTTLLAPALNVWSLLLGSQEQRYKDVASARLLA